MNQATDSSISFPFTPQQFYQQYVLTAYAVEQMYKDWPEHVLTRYLWSSYQELNEILDIYEVMTHTETEPWKERANLDPEYEDARLVYRRHCNKIYKDDYHKVLKDLGDAPEGGEED